MWKFIQQIQRPRVVNAKIVPMESRENYFAQVVVRLHSSQVKQQPRERISVTSPFFLQIMAVYNAVGHVLRGHPSRPNRVIDYVVMERHLETAGSGLGWRIAGKLPPQVPWKALPATADKPQRSLPAA